MLTMTMNSYDSHIMSMSEISKKNNWPSFFFTGPLYFEPAQVSLNPTKMDKL